MTKEINILFIANNVANFEFVAGHADFFSCYNGYFYATYCIKEGDWDTHFKFEEIEELRNNPTISIRSYEEK